MDKVVFDELFDVYEPLHRREELHQLVNLVEWFKPRVILELGVCRGGTWGFWNEILPYDGYLFGIDRLDVVQWDWKASIRNTFYIQGDLDDELTLKRIRGLVSFEGVYIDFLYIDSDHYYEGAKKHFELYSPLVRDGGIIAFHDIRDNKGSGYGVGRFFNELKELYGWLEILVPGEDRGPGADGIGVIFK